MFPRRTTLSALSAMIRKGKAWESNSAATFCSQPHKQASAQGYDNNSNFMKLKLWSAAGCEAEIEAKLSSGHYGIGMA